jgi:hypothetical protein
VQVSGSLHRLSFYHGGKRRIPQIRYCGYTRHVGVYCKRFQTTDNLINKLNLSIMRKLILLAFVFATVLTTSYSKGEINDFTTPENISGTTWKCTSGTHWHEDLEYCLLIFTSTTVVEGWTKIKDEAEQKGWTGSFSISNDSISITFEDESITGIIDGNAMNTTNDDGETYIFLKQ